MRLAFYGMLGLSIVVDLVLGAWASTNWESFVTFWFTGDVNAMLDPGTQLVGFVLSLALFFFAILQILALRWVRGREEEAGYQVAFAFSAYLLLSGVATFLFFRSAPLRFGGLEFLLLDGARGLLLGVMAILAKREPATVSKLRVPKRHRSTARSSHSSDRRSDESSARRSRGKRGSGSGRGGARGGGRKVSDRKSGQYGSRSDEKPIAAVGKDGSGRRSDSRRRRGSGRGRHAS